MTEEEKTVVAATTPEKEEEEVEAAEEEEEEKQQKKEGAGESVSVDGDKKKKKKKKNNKKKKNEASRQKERDEAEAMAASFLPDGKTLQHKEYLPSEEQAELQSYAMTAAVKPELNKALVDKGLIASGKGAGSAALLASGHDFWSKQPVLSPMVNVSDSSAINHPFVPDSTHEEVLKEPEVKLPPGYVWSTIDIDKPSELEELYTLLADNYVEDDDNMFRFNYSPAFLRWALCVPGYIRDWFVGVRTGAPENRLVGFISGIPVSLRIKERVVRMAEINFLCVAKDLRKDGKSSNFAPLLIAEVTHRVHMAGLFQAVYTAGVELPTPFATCRYYHRSLNPRKLIDVGFSYLSSKMTVARAVKLYALPEHPATSGLRPMTKADVPAVHRMLTKYLSKFQTGFVFTQNEIDHWFVPKKGIVHSYVVEDPASHALTGFTSFYTLPSTIIGNTKYKDLVAAYSFYTVNENGTVTSLVSDALILAKNAGFDVYNCLDMMDNAEFLTQLKFGMGDGSLHFYLYNWCVPKMKPNDIGIVLL